MIASNEDGVEEEGGGNNDMSDIDRIPTTPGIAKQLGVCCREKEDEGS